MGSSKESRYTSATQPSAALPAAGFAHAMLWCRPSTDNQKNNNNGEKKKKKAEKMQNLPSQPEFILSGLSSK